MDININNKDQFNELLFENRNKNYGAYVIRKNYDRRLILSSLISLSLIVFAMFSPKMFSGVKQLITPTTKPVKDSVRIIEVKLDPKIDPPKQQHSGSQKKGIAGAIPVPTDTNKVVENDTVKTNFLANNIGDPRGTDTTDIGPIGNGGKTNTIVDPVVKITSFPDVNPEFPGGMEALAIFVRDHMKYPRIALENGIKGTIYLSFVVDQDGKVVDIKSLNSVGGGLDKEAVRVAGLMPNWKPGMLSGEKISVQYSLPIKFSPR